MSEKEKERNASQHRESERELRIFSMMRFDSTTSSFLNLLVFKSYRKKTESTKFQRKVSTFRSYKLFKHFLALDFCQVPHLQDLKSFVGQ